jgi:hypothetical protein
MSERICPEADLSMAAEAAGELPPFEGPAIRDFEGRWHPACLVAHRERPGEWCWQPLPQSEPKPS